MSMPTEHKPTSAISSFDATAEFLAKQAASTDFSEERQEKLVQEILRDLHHGQLPMEFLTGDGEVEPLELFFEVQNFDKESKFLRPLNRLEWFDTAEIEFSYIFGDGYDGEPSYVEIPFDLVWLDLTVDVDKNIRVAPNALRSLRSEMVTAMAEARATTTRAIVEERCVLLVTIDGPAYERPELTILGPSKRSETADDEEPTYAVNVVHLPVNEWAKEDSSVHNFKNRLKARLGALGKRGDEWKAAFRESFETLSKARTEFRRRLRRELETTMRLLEKTRGEKCPDEQLGLLRQAASLFAYRSMFLVELERRGRLYRSAASPVPLGNHQITRTLDDELAYRGADGHDSDAGPEGSLLARLTHTTRVIRNDIEDDSIAITGASIFGNRPENFDSGVGDWLDSIEEVVDRGDNRGLLAKWDDRVQRLSAIMLGHLDAEYREEIKLIGSGADRHRHRVLGNIYEQILAMTPKRGDDDKIRLVVGDGDDDDRSALGAHYTPADLVEEVVRPTLGQLFRQYWTESGENPDEYRRRIEQMTVVDPAMGSAHFLTIAALEIARELAWIDERNKPRFLELEDWDEPLLHQNSIGLDPESDDNAEEADEDSAPREDEFIDPDNHGKFQKRVQQQLPGVIRRSIYGVDVNPLATELGKLSLWLFEIHERAEDDDEEYPELTYLNRNIRCGDSVVGVMTEDVEQTILDAQRKDSAQQSLFGVQKQEKTLKDKLEEAARMAALLGSGAEELSTYDSKVLADYTRGAEWVDGGESDYVRQRRIDQAIRAFLRDQRWIYDLTLTIRFLGYTSRSGEARRKDLFAALYGDEEFPGDGAAKDQIESALQTLFDNPEGAESLEFRENLRNWIETREDINPFHWQLEFPDIFQREGFDAIVANPPFIGDRDLRERLGSEALVEHLANFFIPQQKKSDYSGFFFWRYHQLLNDDGAVGSLASNSIAQASNREYVTKPLTHTIDGDSPAFVIFRAIPNREWPGDANVHFSAIYLARQSMAEPRLIRPEFNIAEAPEMPFDLKHEQAISSYLDEYPDNHLLRLMSSSTQLVFKGFNVRGADNREFDLAKPFSFLERVPEEELYGLAAAFTTTSLQKFPTPTPTKLVVDFYEPLFRADKLTTDADEQEVWLRQTFPVLFSSIEGMREHRRELEGDGYARLRKYWWRFDADAVELRRQLRSASRATFFGETMKVWSPQMVALLDDETNLRVGPTHMVYVNPVDSLFFFGLMQSFLFEMFTRRRCSSLKSDLRFTPTEVFPYFPWPWKPEIDGHRLTIGEPDVKINESLSKAADHLLELRTDILENPTDHGLTRDLVGGPTDLYNLYDSDPDGEIPRPGADAEGINELRQAHVDLLDAVLRAYGWDDLADQCRTDGGWTFERPWLDRTERFVPAEPIRAKLFKRIDKLNTERFELERDMMIDIIADHLPEDGLTKTDFGKVEPFTDMPIDKDQFEEFMKWEREMKGAKARVRHSGSRWYSNG